MKRMPVLLVLIALTFSLLGGFALLNAADSQTTIEKRQKAHDLHGKGNWKEALEIYQALALDPVTSGDGVASDIVQVDDCLRRLNRIGERDAFIEEVVKIHSDKFQVLQRAAYTYFQGDHSGFIVSGDFTRGQHRGGGRSVNATERDRIRALQLMEQALPMVQALKSDDYRRYQYYEQFAGFLLGFRGWGEAWRLQYLTDLSKLPDYEDGYYYRGGSEGAPVDEEGNPVFHYTPKSYEAAKTDGERWRWMLMEALEASPGSAASMKSQFADFLKNQFGVQTMAYYGRYFRQPSGDKDESGTYALHTLKDGETIARLATGVKRFDLPDEFNFIKIYKDILADPEARGYHATAYESLARIYENRRLYKQAAEMWTRCIVAFGKGSNEYRQKALDQIVQNWGMFEPVMSQPKGKGATVDYKFRNGKEVAFVAYSIDLRTYLADVKEYLKANPKQIDHNEINVANIGYNILNNNKKKYLDKEVASWRLELDPAPNHFDRRITVATPLRNPGAYLLTARMDDGNESNIIIWISDMAIVKKALDKQNYIYVGDAVTGAPIAKANVEFFGYRQEYINNKDRSLISTRSYNILTQQFAEYTDPSGQIISDDKSMPANYQWLIIATTPEGRFSYYGFAGVWFNNRYDADYNQTKVYLVTDRPVYRPEQPVKYKFWVRRAQYDMEDTSQFANQQMEVRIHNPKNEEIFKQTFKTDEFGGLDSEFMLPKDATLGTYRLEIHGKGGGTFRVEEYKKPEFEVTVKAPEEPVMLGEKITATIEAKYYFGSPVTNAKVKYKIERTPYDKGWYPSGAWDWFYEPGYWWFGYDYNWYPGWSHWGCRRPYFWWYPQRNTPPEVVGEQTVDIGEDGTVKVTIDTAMAKEVHGDQDHKYEITAEVVDASRRTIVGKGNVLVAREPFKVYAWVDRGHYRVGDTIHANFSARTLDNKPVNGKGRLTLYKITYEDGKPVETPVSKWKLNTDETASSPFRPWPVLKDMNLNPSPGGDASIQIAASEAGQYRIAYQVTDSEGHKIEGAYIFVIRGEGFDGREFKFNNIELVTDKREYAPGDTVNVMINTNRPGSTVLLFLRPTNGVYLPPQVLRLKGKSTVEEIAVVKKDMPNFFIEAFTISDGRIHTETREVLVPPEKRILNVEATASAKEYKPGEDAKVKIKVTDSQGEPFEGSLLASIYDKSVEYISGGSNVGDIKSHFWKWRRRHNPSTESNLERRFSHIYIAKVIQMANLGVFGHSVADEVGDEIVTSRVGEAGGWGGYDARFGTVSRGEVFAGAAMSTKGSMVAMDAVAAPMMAKSRGSLADADFSLKMKEESADMNAPGGAGAIVEATVRSNFADTALWAPTLATDSNGEAEISLKMPENLTTWKIRTWAMGHGTKVGEGSAEVVTRKNLILRLQAPRFFVEKDEVVLSANIHNYLDEEKTVEAVLELDGPCLEPIDTIAVVMSQPDNRNTRKITVKIPAGGEKRVDWRVKVLKEGEAIIRMKALTNEESDAMEMRFPVYVHGIDKMVSFSGVVRPDKDKGTVVIDVPAERRIDDSRLEIRYSPTLAGAMVDALPYLVDYPYGCTEQTLSRFLPTVMTQKVLQEMGVDLKSIRDKQTNLNAQEIGDDKERAKQWKRYEKRNPVFDEEEVNRMVKEGVKRLTSMQVSDGGWGWFSGYGEQSWPHTTAYVVHGLQMAQANDIAIVPGVLQRGVDWLKNYQERETEKIRNWPSEKKPCKRYADNLDAFVYMVLVDADVANEEMAGYLYRDRTQLAVYAKAMLGMAFHKQGKMEERDMLIRNIDQYLVQDEENQTAWLNLPNSGYWWYWYGSEYEAHGYYLKLLSLVDPKGEKASRIVKYLLNNRKHATYWKSTRDTAICVEAFADYLRATDEHKPDMTVEILVDGKKQKEVKITAENLFTFDNKFVLFGDAVETGKHTIELRKAGEGTLYYNAYLSYFTLEDMITSAGLEVKVNRKYFKLNPVEKTIKVSGSRGQALDQRVEKFEREELKNLDTLKSGDLVEIEMTIESKNDYEYLIVEDMKASGFEPVDVQSGYNGNDMGAYMELRDERVCFFVRNLARGKHSVAYRMRAEIPGRFSALPTKISAMYAPELKGNADEIKLKIVD